MTDEVKTVIRDEFREGYQIPSWFTDTAIDVLIDETADYLTDLVKDADFETDYAGRALLKEGMFYSYNHQFGAFAQDFNADLLKWQFSKIGGVS